MEEGDDFSSIDTDNLSCLLYVNTSEFVRKARKLKPKEAKDFLEEMATNDGLAEALESQDKDYDILEALLNKIHIEDDEESLLEAFRTSNRWNRHFV